MLRLLRLGTELHDDRSDVIEALSRQLRCADARQLLGHDDLFVERRAHAAVLLRPMGRAPCASAMPPTDWPQATCALPCGTQLLQAYRGETWRKVLTAEGGGRGATRLRRSPACASHSILMFAALTPSLHRERSAASILSRSSGLPTLFTASSASSRARVS